MSRHSKVDLVREYRVEFRIRFGLSADPLEDAEILRFHFDNDMATSAAQQTAFVLEDMRDACLYYRQAA